MRLGSAGLRLTLLLLVAFWLCLPAAARDGRGDGGSSSANHQNSSIPSSGVRSVAQRGRVLPGARRPWESSSSSPASSSDSRSSGNGGNNSTGTSKPDGGDASERAGSRTGGDNASPSDAAPTSKGASADLPAKIEIGQPKKLQLKVCGRTFRVSARTTGIEDEYLVAATESAWPEIGSMFGKTLTWDKRRNRLRVERNDKVVMLSLGQTKLSDDVGGRQLDVPAQRIDRVSYIPISVLEDFLDVRVTVASDGNNGWIEPLITAVRLEGEGRNPALVVSSSAPISFKTFALSSPERYVIDFSGGVLNTTSLRVHHQEIGDIRLGQFTLGPAVSRVVIPVSRGLKVEAPAHKTGSEFRFAISLPKASASTALTQAKLIRHEIEPTSTGGRLKLQFNSAVQYEWTRLVPPDNRFILDLAPVALAGKKTDYKVNTRNLKGVRLSQFQTKPKAVTRIVFDLKKAVAVKVTPGTSPNSLVVEVADSPQVTTSMLRGVGSTNGQRVAGGSGVAGTVCLDPGHGGSDSGAVHRAGLAVEKDVSLDICLRAAKLLRARGWKVFLTREDDRDVSYAGSSNSEELWARAKVANDAGTDVFVSVHCNAASNTAAVGTSLHVYKRGDRALAEEMYNSVVHATGRYPRGIQQDRFYVLVHTNMPAVLVETAFISNDEGARLLATPAYRQKIAEGIADGLDLYASKYIKTNGK